MQKVGRPKHPRVTWQEAQLILKGRVSKFDTWDEKARVLHEADPKKYSCSALARLFKKNTGTMWWALHPDWRRAERAEIYLKNKDKRRGQDHANYLRRKDDPEFRKRRAVNMRRYRLRKKHDKLMGYIWGRGENNEKSIPTTPKQIKTRYALIAKAPGVGSGACQGQGRPGQEPGRDFQSAGRD